VSRDNRSKSSKSFPIFKASLFIFIFILSIITWTQFTFNISVYLYRYWPALLVFIGILIIINKKLSHPVGKWILISIVLFLLSPIVLIAFDIKGSFPK